MPKIQEYIDFQISVPDQPGELFRITKGLQEAEINLRAMWGFGIGAGHAEIIVVPDDPDQFRAHAEEAGLDVRAVDVETSGNAGGSFVGRGAPGTARLIVDEGRRVVVGATITGAEIAEALHAATIAVVARVPLDDLWHAVPAFPTRSELWLRLLEAYGL